MEEYIMKVELDLSAEQLQELDNGLMNLIKTLYIYLGIVKH